VQPAGTARSMAAATSANRPITADGVTCVD
jgi:hypothetical protein